jgi:hypothetical protein
VVGNLHAGGGGERELGGDGAAVEVFERHRRDRLLLRHGRGRRGGRRVPPVAVDGRLRFLLLLRRAPDRSARPRRAACFQGKGLCDCVPCTRGGATGAVHCFAPRENII